MRITARIEARRAARGFGAARRGLRRDVGDVMADSARRRVLPIAKRLAPRIISGTLIVRGTATGAELTTDATGMQRRIVGFTNFGGVVRTPIEPRRGRALRLANGAIVARVSAPRRFDGLHYLEDAVDEQAADIARDLDRELPRIVQRRLDGITG